MYILFIIIGAVAVYAIAGKKVKNYLVTLQHIRSNKKPAKLVTDKPMISFTFDDIPQSAVDAAGMLKAYNANGTFYICMKLMDSSSNEQVFFNKNSLQQLINDGHEIASHTYAHINCKTSSTKIIEEDLQQNQQEFKQFSSYNMQNFAYPFGEFNAESKKITKDFFNSSRSILPGINDGEIDLNLLKANKLYDNIPVEKTVELINENAKRKGWLILYTHDVQEKASVYGCSPKYFQEVLKAAIASGAEIVTVRDALKKVVPL